MNHFTYMQHCTLSSNCWVRHHRLGTFVYALHSDDQDMKRASKGLEICNLFLICMWKYYFHKQVMAIFSFIYLFKDLLTLEINIRHHFFIESKTNVHFSVISYHCAPKPISLLLSLFVEQLSQGYKVAPSNYLTWETFI